MVWQHRHFVEVETGEEPVLVHVAEDAVGEVQVLHAQNFRMFYQRPKPDNKETIIVLSDKTVGAQPCFFLTVLYGNAIQ